MSSSSLAVLCAVAAATLLGCATVAQRRGMGAPTGPSDPGGLVAILVRSRWWWAGTIASVAGLGLQFLALSTGPLIVVQTTMVASIVVTTLAESLLLRRRPTPRRWTGMVLTTLGLATVLVALSPTSAAVTVTPSASSVVVLAGITLALLAGATLRARLTATTGIALSVATGLGYGVTAVALKTVGAELASGWTVPLGHPALWTAVVVGPLSVLLSQDALRRARAVAAAVSVIVVIDPVVGLLAGVAWFGEHVVVTPLSLTAALAAAVAVVVGIVLGHTEPRPPRPGDDPSERTGSTARPEPVMTSVGGRTRP
ncbi:MAG TPA: DMT family transporter [Actinomycetospora sp.]|jgi:drug/metabolite transporter (DMT)-like permease|uniref:DMT family transporter n=1 Tax=Actinomycetospora sp. TaxID=1872135 RepID=UPI002F41DACE